MFVARSVPSLLRQGLFGDTCGALLALGAKWAMREAGDDAAFQEAKRTQQFDKEIAADAFVIGALVSVALFLLLLPMPALDLATGQKEPYHEIIVTIWMGITVLPVVSAYMVHWLPHDPRAIALIRRQTSTSLTLTHHPEITRAWSIASMGLALLLGIIVGIFAAFGIFP